MEALPTETVDQAEGRRGLWVGNPEDWSKERQPGFPARQESGDPLGQCRPKIVLGHRSRVRHAGQVAQRSLESGIGGALVPDREAQHQTIAHPVAAQDLGRQTRLPHTRLADDRDDAPLPQQGLLEPFLH